MRKISMSSLKTVIFCVCVAMLVAVSLEAGIVMAQIEAVSKTSAEKLQSHQLKLMLRQNQHSLKHLEMHQLIILMVCI